MCGWAFFINIINKPNTWWHSLMFTQCTVLGYRMYVWFNLCSGFVTFWYGSGSGCRSCSFRQWLPRCQQKKVFFPDFVCLLLSEGIFTSVFKDIKSLGIHWSEKSLSWWKDPDPQPDPYKIITVRIRIQEAQKPVWRIRDVYPGSRIRLFSIPDPGSELSPSRIPDPHQRIKVFLPQKKQENGF